MSNTSFAVHIHDLEYLLFYAAGMELELFEPYETLRKSFPPHACLESRLEPDQFIAQSIAKHVAYELISGGSLGFIIHQHMSIRLFRLTLVNFHK